MAIGAIKVLRGRNGSSVPAITKYIMNNITEQAFKKHCLSAALKRGVKSGVLVKVKASYKLGEKVTTKACSNMPP